MLQEIGNGPAKKPGFPPYQVPHLRQSEEGISSKKVQGESPFFFFLQKKSK